MKKNTLLLLILDGFGHKDETEYNAISQANTPNWDLLRKNYPNTLIDASESYVGLPEGQMGNSEVGHLCIGAGRVISQDLDRINGSINDGSFFLNEVLNAGLNKVSINNNALHIFGLLSDGGVHSHIDHILALVKHAKNQNVKKVFIHSILDGRDTPPKSASMYIKKLEDFCNKISLGEIKTVSGRFYAMDRDNRWERTNLAYDAIVKASSKYTAPSAQQALEKAYKRDEFDEFVYPTLIKSTESYTGIQDNDMVVFMNFRSDRARQLTNSILDEAFDNFERTSSPKNIDYFTLTSHDERQKKSQCIFKPINIKNSLGEYVSALNKTQLRIAETEKYPHVTFFFNGGHEESYKGEDRILIPSQKVKTYDLLPEMSAYQITDKLNEAIMSENYDLIVCNYANGDMVGHTGNLAAAIEAIEVIDKCIGLIFKTIKKVGGQIIITADHGNAEEMMDKKNQQKHTQHTINKVPFLYVGKQIKKIKDGGTLADIAPTILELMGERKPKEMTGKNLIES
ncbi:2,3-bisphosphoglycerate-independent phosphoglycerate mutase [Methylophilaceae bacterium]|nr:2,3-bisphosphoglycerate-independent phosphoglycerate mutase [Methylophilaceae bacterium]